MPNNTKTAEPLDYLFDGFLLHQRSRGSTKATVFYYTRYITNFLDYLETNHRPSTYDDLTPNDIRSYFLHLADTPGTRGPRRPASIHAAARAVRAFLIWAAGETDLPNPMSKVEMPRLPDAWKVTTLNSGEIQRLFAACDLSSPGLVLRNRALLSLLLDTGLRASELLSLRVGSVAEVGEVRSRPVIRVLDRFEVLGKGRKRRTVYMGTTAQQELRKYLREHPAGTTPAAPLWLTRDRQELVYSGLKEFFRRLKKISGVEKVHAHVCRHTFATQAHRNGMGGAALQDILGHSDFTVTKKYYLDISSDDLAREHHSFGPLDRLELAPRRHINESKQVAGTLPGPEVLQAEVSTLGFRGTGRKYGVSDTTIRDRLKKAGLM